MKGTCVRNLCIGGVSADRASQPPTNHRLEVVAPHSGVSAFLFDTLFREVDYHTSPRFQTFDSFMPCRIDYCVRPYAPGHREQGCP